MQELVLCKKKLASCVKTSRMAMEGERENCLVTKLVWANIPRCKTWFVNVTPLREFFALHGSI